MAADDPRYDPDLLADGDRRNVVDPTATGAATRSSPTSTRGGTRSTSPSRTSADHNIGTVVRTANAFAAAEVHIVGRRRWNRRGAMVTDRYQHLRHRPDVAAARVRRARTVSASSRGRRPRRHRIETAPLPRDCLLLFGAPAGPASAPPKRHRAAAALTVSIAQFGSTRSINAGVAAGIAMHAWVRQHADLVRGW